MDFAVLSMRVVLKIRDLKESESFEFIQEVLKQVWIEAKEDKRIVVEDKEICREDNVTYVKFDKDKLH